jgi:hypothetical protein
MRFHNPETFRLVQLYTAPLLAALLAVTAVPAFAADLTVYDDALQNSFLNYSYGGVPADFNFASTAQVHGGTKSIAFIGDSFNALSFDNETLAFTTAQYPVLHFWVHGGTVGNQQLRIYLQSAGGIVANAELDTYITGGAPAAGAWREVTVNLGSAPLSYSGPFNRIDLQSDIGGIQPVLYLDDITLVPPAPAVNTLVINHDVTVGSMVSDRFTWLDSASLARVAVLAHNDGQSGPGGTRGGELREFHYETPGGTRIVSAASTSGASGFGYVVSHPDGGELCIGGPDSSALGHFFTGSYTRVFEGRHHAIFRFSQNYPRYCATGATPAAPINVPVTIDWVFSTGRDNPLWAITYDMSATPVNTLNDDSRAPYGELLFDGAASEAAHSAIAGAGWGDRYKFIPSANPVTYNSAWTWNTANTIPYVKLWTTAVSATMGTVQTQPITQQDAGGYWGVGRWNTTSAGGAACPAGYDGASSHLMPCSFNWPYQSINYSMGAVVGGSDTVGTNNTRLAWGTNFGFLGQSSYLINGSASYGGPLPDTAASGWPRKSYSEYIVLGLHSNAPVEAQVTQVETAQTLTLSAAIGSVVTSGPAGVNRVDTITYPRAGYNPVYGALAWNAAGNALDANIAVGAGTLKKPLIILGNYSAGLPTVKLAGVTLLQDTDYFPSLRSSPNELWLTLNRDLTGAVNHLEILSGCAVPASPVTGVKNAKSGGNLVVTWTDIAGATGYNVNQDTTPGGAFATLTGTVVSGNPGLTLAMPAGSSLFFKVVGKNACGNGP